MEEMTRSRTQNSTYNVAFGIINKLVIMLLTFVSRTIFLRVLSAEYLGINGLFSDVLNMLSLADLGFSSAMAYSFYKPLAEHNEERIASLNKFYKKVYNYVAAAVAVVGVALTPFLKYIVNTEKEIPYLHIYYLVFLTNTVVSYLFVYKSTIISADQKSYIISKYSMWINVVKLVAQTIVLFVTKNYFCYILVTVLSTVANNLLISYKADKLYPYIKYGSELDKQEKKSIFENMKSVFLYKLSSVLLKATDNILISVIVGTVAVGLYSNYHTIITNFTAITTILFNSLTASVGNLIVKENAQKRYSVLKIMQMVSFWLSGFFSVGVYFLSDEFITLWLGKEYLLSNGTLIAIVLNFYLAVCLPPIWSFREATGLYRKTKYIMLVTAGLNLILSVILGKGFGIGGIILASFIAKITTYFWYEPKLLYKNYFEKSVKEYYVNHIINAGIVIFSILLLEIIAGNNVKVSWGSFILRGLLVAVIVNIIYLLRYGRQEEFRDLINRGKGLLHKEK